MKKTLLILRHAHRSKRYGSVADNGLSARGKQQAQSILRRYRNRFSADTQIAILSSPKKRCIQTVEGISRYSQVTIHPITFLDEGGDLDRKVREFLRNYKKIARKKSLVIVSAHGDWIPIFFEKALSIELEMSKGAWAELEWKKGQWILRELVQDLTL